MNRIYNKDKRIESHHWFPYIAWAVVIIFAFFVYYLSNSVAEKITGISEADIDEEAYLIPIEELQRQNRGQ